MRRLLAALVLVPALVFSLQAQTTWSKKTYPVTRSRVERADFNGDGVPDLLLYGGGGTVVLLNTGNGTFDTNHVFATNALSRVAFLDFNRDGKTDVAGCDGSGNFLILLGGGDGTLTVAQSIPNGCAWVAVSDFNKDGNPDVAVGAPSQAADSTGNQVIVYLGDGQGGIASQVVNSNVDYSSSDGSACAIDGAGAAADFNGDRLSDIVITANCTRDLFQSSVLIVGAGDGTGHFSCHKDSDQSWDAGQQVRLVDLYQDGGRELIGKFTETFPFANEAVAILAFRSMGDGTFSSVNDVVQTDTSEANGDTITAYTVADVDGDGIKDIVVGIHTSSIDSPPPDSWSLRVFKGNADHTYTQIQNSSLASAIGDMTWADFNKDSRPDLVLARPSSTDVWLNTTSSFLPCTPVNDLRVMVFCPSDAGVGVMHFKATPYDNRLLNSIQVYVDGAVKFETPDDLLSANVAMGSGQHRVTVKGWDDLGPFSTTKILTAKEDCINTANRTVKICEPQNGAVITGTSGDIRLIAAAATNRAFNSLQVYVDGKLTFHTTAKDIDITLLLVAGTHRVTVKGWDTLGSFSSAVTVATH